MSEAPSHTPPTALERVREEIGLARASLRTDAKHQQRLIQRLEADDQKASEAPVLRDQGEVLKTQLAAVPRGADRVVLAVPWEPERTVTVELKRDLSPAQNLERLFRRARGLEKGAAIIAERWAAAHDRLGRVQDLAAKIDGLLARVAAEAPPVEGAANPSLGVWLREARQLREATRGLRLKVETVPATSVVEKRIVRKAGGALPEGVQLFSSPAGRPVLVGRSAAGNDALVTRLLRGRDLWFHVQDRPGAHVVLRVDGKVAPEEAELRACAMLAAHLSGIEKGDRIEVTCAPGNGVRKVKGAPPGMVYLSGGRGLRVDVDAAVVDGFYTRRPPPR
jgi:predicted ribosome quality control (RQC) complex YloA/Tae2 family protein